MEPRYSRDEEITVATFANEGRGCGLVVGVNEGRVVLSMDMEWEASPGAIGDVCAALRSAALLAAQWTERDQRIADLMRRRVENSHLWYKDIDGVVAEFRGVLWTPTAQRTFLAMIRHVRDRLVAKFGELEIPEFTFQYRDHDRATLEPVWERMPQYRWTE